MQLILTTNLPKVDSPNTTVITDISLLDIMVDDNECKHIVVDSFLSGFTINEIPVVLDKILKKLRINGTIIITDIDIEIISNALLLSTIDIETFNQIIFSGSNVKSLLTIELVKNLLWANEIKVSRSYIENNFFVLEAKREING